jgi:hypothetical protein
LKKLKVNLGLRFVTDYLVLKLVLLDPMHLLLLEKNLVKLVMVLGHLMD